jgi:aryl-alcohol dehydrogenase-like predicted oxidoreductase
MTANTAANTAADRAADDRSGSTRVLGRSGIEVSALGVGCWAIGGPWTMGPNQAGWGAVDDEESVRALRAAMDAGVTFFDTAATYGAGHSETVLGRAVGARRSEVVLATKFGYPVDEAGRHVDEGADVSPAAIERSCADSLRRLGTDWVDLFQLHVGDLDPALADDVVDTLEGLVGTGMIRGYGWSTDDVDRARRFARGPHCTAVQHRLNVLEDAPEMLALCAEQGLAAVNRTPLAMGLLAGRYDQSTRFDPQDLRAHRIGWMEYFVDGRPDPRWLARVEAVRQVLTSGGRTLAQGALAWIWARSPVTVPVPGVRTVAQAEGNAAALAHGPLTAAELAEIERILA